jgi:hypothetical protein
MLHFGSQYSLEMCHNALDAAVRQHVAPLPDERNHRERVKEHRERVKETDARPDVDDVSTHVATSSTRLTF